MKEYANERNSIGDSLSREHTRHVSQKIAKMLVEMDSYLVRPIGGVLEVHVDYYDRTIFQHEHKYYKSPELDEVVRFVNLCGYTFDIPNKKCENGDAHLIVYRNLKPVHKIQGKTYSRLTDRAIAWCINKINQEK